jgi:hypothetical protein
VSRDFSFCFSSDESSNARIKIPKSSFEFGVKIGEEIIPGVHRPLA